MVLAKLTNSSRKSIQIIVIFPKSLDIEPEAKGVRHELRAKCR